MSRPTEPQALRRELRRRLQGCETGELQRALQLVLLELEAELVQRRMLAPGLPQRARLEAHWLARREERG